MGFLFRRPLACAAAGLCAGLWAGLRWPLAALVPALYGLALVALAAALLFRYRGRRGVAALCLLAGLSAGLARVQPMGAGLRALPGEGLQAQWIEGRVMRDRGVSAESGRRSLILDRVRLRDLRVPDTTLKNHPGRLRVSFDARKKENSRPFAPGDRLGFKGNLWFTPPPTNPGEFDYRAYQLGRGITANAAPHSKAAVRFLEVEGGMPLSRLAWRANRRLGAAFDRHLDPRLAALARGAILGDKSGLERRDVKAYTRSGLAYLLAVSGLHLALALGLFMAMAKFASSNRAVQALLALVAVIAYAFITGLQVPAQRAACLFVLMLVARAADLETDFAVSLAFGAILVLLAQPGAMWEAGFQLSFLVTASIVYVGSQFTRRLQSWMPGWAAAFFGVVWSAQVAVVPLTAYHFHQFTWPAFVSDGSVAWAMPLIIGLGLLAGGLDLVSSTLASWAALPLGWCLAWLDRANAFFADLPGAVRSVGEPGGWFILGWLIFAGALATRLLAREGQALKALALAAVMLLWTLWPSLPFHHRHAGETRTWFLDVGQGDSILVEFEDGKTLLVDAGTNRPDAGSWVVEPVLRSLGISRVDWVALSHPHADHVGGLHWLAGQVPLGHVYHSGFEYKSSTWKNLVRELESRGVPLQALRGGEEPPDWEGKIKVLLPGAKPLGGGHTMHNNGLVLMVENWLLLPGDLGHEGEAALVRLGLAGVEVLKVGHHGSRTASSARFIEAARPRHAVIQAGRRYIYKHPHAQALENLDKVGSKIWRTDLQGCITLFRGPDALKWSTWQAAKPQTLLKPGKKPFRPDWKTLLAEKPGP